MAPNPKATVTDKTRNGSFNLIAMGTAPLARRLPRQVPDEYRVIVRFLTPPIPETHLRSPLPRAACIERLRAGIDSPWTVFGSRAVIGDVGPLYASLRRRVRWRSPFRVCLDISLLDDRGTVLICRRGLHPLAALLAGGWFGLIVAMVGLVSVFAVAGGLLERYWPLLTLPPLLLAAVVVGFLLGRGDPAGDHAFLIERLTLMTDATAV